MKLPNFDNWPAVKNWASFQKKIDLKVGVIKKCAPRFVFFNEKKSERFR